MVEIIKKGNMRMDYITGLVSVIIPTYKRSSLLNRTIDSVLNQTYKNLECIVVNDNIPGDEFSKILYKQVEKYYQDKRFVFVEQERHINGAEARNCGIKIAKGEFIAFLDDDDWWKPEKIEHQINYMKSMGESCGGVSTLVEFYSKGKAIRWTRPYQDGKIYLQILSREVDVTTCSVMLVHKALDDSGYFDNSLKRHQEIQLLSYFTYKYNLALLKEYLTCVDCDDCVRNPSSEQIIQIKQDFYKSVKPIIDSLDESDKKKIYIIHDLEIALVLFREKKYTKALIRGIKAIKPLGSLKVVLKTIKKRREEYIIPKDKM